AGAGTSSGTEQRCSSASPLRNIRGAGEAHPGWSELVKLAIAVEHLLGRLDGGGERGLGVLLAENRAAHGALVAVRRDLAGTGNLLQEQEAVEHLRGGELRLPAVGELGVLACRGTGRDVAGSRPGRRVLAHPRNEHTGSLAAVLVCVGLLGEGEIVGVREYSRSVSDRDRKSTRLNSSHVSSSYAVFWLK